MAKTNTKSTKKRKVIVESVGEAHITASFNNIDNFVNKQKR